eukprot:6389218-Pyramimonas_sp.AAC.1
MQCLTGSSSSISSLARQSLAVWADRATDAHVRWGFWRAGFPLRGDFAVGALFVPGGMGLSGALLRACKR